MLTLLAILYTNQEKMLYMPNPPGFPRTPLENPPGYQSPASWGTNGRMLSSSSSQDHIEFEEGFVTTADGLKIHIWLLLQPNSEDVPTLLYFHGNAGNMGFLLKNAALMYAHAKINILLMDYRGYGKKDGMKQYICNCAYLMSIIVHASRRPQRRNSFRERNKLGRRSCSQILHGPPTVTTFPARSSCTSLEQT